MSHNIRTVGATTDQVWDVLSDGWLFPVWVVGATRMREVDNHWPGVGTQLHHSVGSWPLMLDDTTEVLDAQPAARLVLRARARPFGVAEVTVQLTEMGHRTQIELSERAVSGPLSLIPGSLQDPMLKWRNKETLQRLAYLVEDRADSTPP